MSEQLTQRIAKVLRKHAAFHTGGGLIECACGLDMLTVTEHAEHVAEAVVAALQLADTVRLLQAAGSWIAGAVSEDPSGEPWLMSRTLLNELFTRVDELGGWPPVEVPS